METLFLELETSNIGPIYIKERYRLIYVTILYRKLTLLSIAHVLL